VDISASDVGRYVDAAKKVIGEKV
jgi:copper/silver efflux system protein